MVSLLQLTLLLIYTLKLFDVAEIIFPSFTNGQITHLWHLFIPIKFLFGLPPGFFGTFALISLSFILGGILLATRGGLENISFLVGSCFIEHQCSVSSQLLELRAVLDNKNWSEDFFLYSLLRASFHGIFLAFWIAASITQQFHKIRQWED